MARLRSNSRVRTGSRAIVDIYRDLERVALDETIVERRRLRRCHVRVDSSRQLWTTPPRRDRRFRRVNRANRNGSGLSVFRELAHFSVPMAEDTSRKRCFTRADRHTGPRNVRRGRCRRQSVNRARLRRRFHDVDAAVAPTAATEMTKPNGAIGKNNTNPTVSQNNHNSYIFSRGTIASVTRAQWSQRLTGFDR